MTCCKPAAVDRLAQAVAWLQSRLAQQWPAPDQRADPGRIPLHLRQHADELTERRACAWRFNLMDKTRRGLLRRPSSHLRCSQ